MAGDSRGKNCEPQVTHRLRVSPEMFRALAFAQYKASAATLASSSARRFITGVVEDPAQPLFRLSIAELEQICCEAMLLGSVPLHIRLDATVNDRLGEFRDYAEARLSRPIGVIELINACIHVAISA